MHQVLTKRFQKLQRALRSHLFRRVQQNVCYFKPLQENPQSFETALEVNHKKTEKFFLRSKTVPDASPASLT